MSVEEKLPHTCPYVVHAGISGMTPSLTFEKHFTPTNDICLHSKSMYNEKLQMEYQYSSLVHQERVRIFYAYTKNIYVVYYLKYKIYTYIDVQKWIHSFSERIKLRQKTYQIAASKQFFFSTIHILRKTINYFFYV